ATIRSKETVISAVIAKIQASPRVETMIARTVATCTMRIAVMNSTPARAASGIIPTGPAATYTTASSTRAWTIEAMRVRAPARRLTEVRAIAPVAGMPPNREAPIEATPWPTSSRSGSKAPVSAMVPATRADSSDSIAASAATVSAGEQHRDQSGVDRRQRGSGQARRDRPDRGQRRRGDHREDRDHADADQGPGDRG